jgi:hypothetical protein
MLQKQKFVWFVWFMVKFFFNYAFILQVSRQVAGKMPQGTISRRNEPLVRWGMAPAFQSKNYLKIENMLLDLKGAGD